LLVEKARLDAISPLSHQPLLCGPKRAMFRGTLELSGGMGCRCLHE
jgi:hypothetical protein